MCIHTYQVALPLQLSRVAIDQAARLHLQELLVSPLPREQLLKCEVLAQLGRSHKFLGETAFQRQCYLKGLELCKDSNSSSGSGTHK